MKPFKISYDEKTPAFEIDHSNILKDEASEYAECLIIKQFQVAVQVAFGKDIQVSDATAVEKAIKTTAEELRKQAQEAVKTLHEKLVKLKKEEDAGNEKAADQADKDVKATKKQLQKIADEFGAEIRETVEGALKKQSNSKVKGRSASRCVLRGFDLNEDFFDAETVDNEPSPYFSKLADELHKAGKELAKATVDEKKLRTDLARDITEFQKIVEKASSGSNDFDIKQFAKDNHKEARTVESAVAKYLDHIKGMEDKIEATHKPLDKFNKLVAGLTDPGMKDGYKGEMTDFEKALKTVDGTLKEKRQAGESAQRLFKDDYDDGKWWKSLCATLESLKAAAKSGGAMEEIGAKVAKIAKEYG